MYNTVYSIIRNGDRFDIQGNKIIKYGSNASLAHTPGSATIMSGLPRGTAGIPQTRSKGPQQNYSPPLRNSKSKARKYKFPAIDELPPEGRGVNFNPSGAGSAAVNKEAAEKRFRLGQEILFFNIGKFEPGIIITHRVGNRYQIRSLMNGRDQLISEKSIRIPR